MIIIQCIVGFLIGIGLFLIFCDLLHIPYSKPTKMIGNIIHAPQLEKTGRLEIAVADLSNKLAKVIRLNEYKKLQLEADLQSADIKSTAEHYVAQAIVEAGLYSLIFAIPCMFIPILLFLVPVFGIAMYLKNINKIQIGIEKRREAIEYELPRLVWTIDRAQNYSRDVLSILKNYKQQAGTELGKELDVTLADMESGNYEIALTRLEGRIGSSMVSDVTRGLIGLIRGDNTDLYWANLSIKFADIQRQELKREAVKVPDKIGRLSMMFMFCFIAIYFVVLLTQIINSLGVVFG